MEKLLSIFNQLGVDKLIRAKIVLIKVAIVKPSQIRFIFDGKILENKGKTF